MKLDGTNYREWFASIHPLFDSPDLSYIDGTQSSSITFGAKSDWDVADGHACGILSFCDH